MLGGPPFRSRGRNSRLRRSVLSFCSPVTPPRHCARCQVTERDKGVSGERNKGNLALDLLGPPRAHRGHRELWRPAGLSLLHLWPHGPGKLSLRDQCRTGSPRGTAAAPRPGHGQLQAWVCLEEQDGVQSGYGRGSRVPQEGRAHKSLQKATGWPGAPGTSQMLGVRGVTLGAPGLGPRGSKGPFQPAGRGKR